MEEPPTPRKPTYIVHKQTQDDVIDETILFPLEFKSRTYRCELPKDTLCDVVATERESLHLYNYILRVTELSILIANE